MQGVGQVVVGGSALPGVRVELNPTQLNNYGLGLEDVRTVLATPTPIHPRAISGDTSWTLGATDQLLKADEYKPLIVTYHNGAAVRLSDIAEVTDSVEDLRNAGYGERQAGRSDHCFPPARRQHYRHRGPGLPAAAIAGVHSARHQTERDARPHHDHPGVGARCGKDAAHFRRLVILVVFVFLRDVRVTLIPGVAVPVSLIGTFGVMYLLGFSLDNLSLMALTISTGFVVDDAIVVLENIIRYVEQGCPRLKPRSEAPAKSASPWSP